MEINIRYPKDEELLIEILKFVFKDNLDKILVFGSRGYGEPKNNSDWDVLVMLKNKETRNSKRLKDYINLKFNQEVDLFLVQSKTFFKYCYDFTYLLGQILISSRVIYDSGQM